MVFDAEGDKFRNKRTSDYITVSVVMDMERGNTKNQMVDEKGHRASGVLFFLGETADFETVCDFFMPSCYAVGAEKALIQAASYYSRFVCSYCSFGRI